MSAGADSVRGTPGAAAAAVSRARAGFSVAAPAEAGTGQAAVPAEAGAGPAAPALVGESRLRPGETVVGRVDPANPTHRERLLEAMAESIREHGFKRTTVAEVVGRARTSRRTFYEHFADRDACFLELFDAMNAVLSLRIAAALDPSAPWQEQVDAAVGVYIDEVTAEPEIIRACVHEIPAIGEAGIARHHDEVERFADLLVALVAVVNEVEPELAPMQRSTAILLTGGLRELIAHPGGASPADLKATAAGVIKAVLAPAARG